MVTKPLSQRGRTGQPTGCLVVFFSIFLLAGSAFFYFVAVRPASRILAARSWQVANCTVVESRVAESRDSDSTTYRPEIVYTYSRDGREYRSDRYDFLGLWSSGRSGKEEIVARYPPGARVPCWVDPTRPEEAVLTRDFRPAYLFGLFPLLFVAVGAGGLVWVVRSARRAGAAAATPARPSPVSPFGAVPAPTAGSGPLELRPTASPVAKLLGFCFLALFWNGIVSVFLWHVVASWRSGQPNGCLTAFLTPFVLVGLGLIYAVFRQFLVLFNPRPHLTLNPGSLAPGESAYLMWRLEGSSRRVRRFRVLLEGREEARYRRGTNTYTDRQTFASVRVVDTAQPFEIAAGSTGFSLPADAVPSFAATHNKIVWSLKVQAEIPGWPDSEDEYEILVRPAAVSGGGF